MADRLSDGAVVAAIGANDHRGRRGLALAAERAFVGQDDMHPRRLDAAHHLDRARELALERAHRVTSCMNDVRPSEPSLS